MTMQVKNDRTNELMESVGELVKKKLVVGLIGARNDTDLSNMQVGLTMEFGSPARNIPARPFLKPGIEEGKERFAAIIKRGVQATLNGDKSAVDAALNIVGQEAVGLVKRKINTGPFVPLKPATVRRKGHSKPLIDTRQLFNSVQYQLRSR